MIHRVTHDVTFGDCDPAGIVFYPNIYRWLDRTFHDWLRRYGGHAALCRSLGFAGIGLREASARFLRPLRDGDRLTVALETVEWSDKGLGLGYAGRLGEALHFTAREERAVFVATSTGIRAGDTLPLKQVIEAHGATR